MLERYKKAFNADTVEFVSSSCFGKWANTVDYSLKINGDSYSLGNSSCGGKKYAEQKMKDDIEMYEKFIEKKPDLLNLLNEIKKQDDVIAERMGLSKYEILDVDFLKSGLYIGWFVVRLRANGREFNHLETGLYLRIVDYLKKNKEFTGKEEYHTAGGLKDFMVDYVFLGTGFSSERLYKA